MRPTTPNDGGFTLMEVLAALLIFSLSILGLMGSVSQSARVATEVELKSLAGIVADNTVASVRSRLAGQTNVGSAPLPADVAEVDLFQHSFTASHNSERIPDTRLTEHTVTVRQGDRVLSTRTFFTVEQTPVITQ